VVKDNAHEPIIDPGLFERVQAKLKSRVITIGCHPRFQTPAFSPVM
jgi:hypothetical protein